MSESKHPSINTPYDDAFKSIVKKCPRLAVPLINEMFFRTGLSDEEYTGSEKIVLLDKELPSLDSPGREMDLRLMIFGSIAKTYHLECQSGADGTIVLRLVRYNMLSALEEADYTQSTIRIQMDDSGLLFLRSTKNTPSVMTVELLVPQNQSISYQIPVIKMQNYSLETILAGRLFILLPFLFFNYEQQLKQMKDHQDVYRQIQELFDSILSRLRSQAESGNLTAYEASTLYDALKIVLDALAKKNQAVEEVEVIMGGKILEFSADKYYDAGKADGEVIGEARGEARGEGKGTIRTLWGLVIDNLLELDTAAARANLSVSDFQEQGKALMGEPVTTYIANLS